MRAGGRRSVFERLALAEVVGPVRVHLIPASPVRLVRNGRFAADMPPAGRVGFLPSSGFFRYMTRIFPICWTGSDSVRRQSSCRSCSRCPWSELNTRTLISSWLLRLRSASASTPGESPSLLIISTGLSAWARDLRSRRCAGDRTFMYWPDAVHVVHGAAWDIAAFSGIF